MSELRLAAVKVINEADGTITVYGNVEGKLVSGNGANQLAAVQALLQEAFPDHKIRMSPQAAWGAGKGKRSR